MFKKIGAPLCSVDVTRSFANDRIARDPRTPRIRTITRITDYDVGTLMAYTANVFRRNVGGVVRVARVFTANVEQDPREIRLR